MSFFCTLLLEGKEDSIHKLLFQFRIYICDTLVRHDFLDSFYNDFSISFIFVFELLLELFDNLSSSYFSCNFSSRFDQLFIVFLVESIPSDPEIAEKLWNNIFPDVDNLDSWRCYSLFHYFEHDFLHFIVLSGEFSYQNWS
jgi:hypothetical protein